MLLSWQKNKFLCTADWLWSTVSGKVNYNGSDLLKSCLFWYTCICYKIQRATNKCYARTALVFRPFFIYTKSPFSNNVALSGWNNLYVRRYTCLWSTYVLLYLWSSWWTMALWIFALVLCLVWALPFFLNVNSECSDKPVRVRALAARSCDKYKFHILEDFETKYFIAQTLRMTAK